MKKPKKLHKYDDANASALHHAAEEGQVELMDMIIRDSSCEGNKRSLTGIATCPSIIPLDALGRGVRSYSEGQLF